MLRNNFFFAIPLFVVFACGGTAPAQTEPGRPTETPPPPPEETGSVDYLIVTGDALAGAAARFASYREGQGHRVSVARTSELVADAFDRPEAVDRIAAHVKKLHATRDAKKPFFVLLLGDAETKDGFAPFEVPAGRFTGGSVNVTSDNMYADVDGDAIPDLAVGRVPVRTEAEADAILEKIRTYESTYEVGAWNRRLSIFASTGGFGEPIDSQIEAAVFRIVEEIPYGFDMTLTYAKQSSPYVFVPERFSDKVYERMNEGALMVTYAGHGDVNGFADLDWNGQLFPILDTSAVERVAAEHRLPILTLIACLTGGFEKGDSVSEQFLKARRGPIAVLSSTEISHPYTNAIFIRELGSTITAAKSATLGEAFVETKRRMIQNDDALRRELDAQVELFLSPADREELKMTHLHMYTLIGDPALRVTYPHLTAMVAGPAQVRAGETAQVDVTLKKLVAGRVSVSLERARSVDSPGLKSVPPDGDALRDSVIEQNYAASNDRTVVSTRVDASSAKVSTSLVLPSALAPGEYHLKVYAEDGRAEEVGATKLRVLP